MLKLLELNRAFAYVDLTFVFVPLLSYFILNEKVTIVLSSGFADHHRNCDSANY